MTKLLIQKTTVTLKVQRAQHGFSVVNSFVKTLIVNVQCKCYNMTVRTGFHHRVFITGLTEMFIKKNN